ncbi:MAG: HD domain-containing protein [Desulfatibacillum sp.]|nr:HD domain-containing protein [Desulfatibacillum sp.]
MKSLPSISSDPMIDRQDVDRYAQWFRTYAKGFYGDDGREWEACALKRRHTFRVMGEIGVLGKSLELSPEDMNLARTMALFHDVGRFVQYARFKTFVDAISADHGRLSVEVLREEYVLDDLSAQNRDLIMYCVEWHNKKELPPDASPREKYFLRLLRDADKLDIWRVVTAHYNGRSEAPRETVELGLPRTGKISPRVHAEILAGGVVNSLDLKTAPDFMALQMGWVFDLNLYKSFELLHKRAYLEKIARALPPSREARQIYRKVRSYLDERLQGKQEPQACSLTGGTNHE